MKKINGPSIDSILLMLIKVVTTFSSLIITKLLSVKLSLYDYGTYSQAFIVISIITAIISLGLVDALNYFFNINIKKEEKCNYINTIFGVEILAGVLLGLIVLLFGKQICLYFSNEFLYEILFIVSLKPLFDNLIYYYQVLFVSIKKAKIIAYKNLVLCIIKVVAIYLALTFSTDLILIFIVIISLDILQLLFFKFTFNKLYDNIKPYKISIPKLMPIFRYCIPMGIFSLTSSLMREVDKLIIGSLGSNELLAIYSNCSKILPLDVVVVSFTTVLIPYIMRYVSEKRFNETSFLYKNYLKIGYFSAWTFGFSILINPNYFINLLYSEEYTYGIAVFIIYIIDSMLKFASMHLILTANKQTKFLMILSISALVFNSILDIVLYNLFGFCGPAIATLITTLLYIVILFIKTKILINAKISDIVDCKEFFAYLGISICLTLIFGFFCKYIVEHYGCNEFIITALSIILYLFIVLIIFYKRILNAVKNINDLKIED